MTVDVSKFISIIKIHGGDVTFEDNKKGKKNKNREREKERER